MREFLDGEYEITVLLRARLLEGLGAGRREMLALRFMGDGLIGESSAAALSGTLETVWQTLSARTRFGVLEVEMAGRGVTGKARRTGSIGMTFSSPYS